MAGKLDQISQAIGGLQESSKALVRTFEQHAEDDDRRHRENLDTLRGIERELADLAKKRAEMRGMSRAASFIWTAVIAIGTSAITLFADKHGVSPHP